MALTSLLLAAFAASAAAEDSLRLTEDDRELLSWYEELGLPSTTDRPFVRVATGHLERGCCRGPQVNAWRFGFLLDEDEESFTVLHSVWPEVYLRQPVHTGAKPPSFERVDFQEQNLHSNAGLRLVSWAPLVRTRARPSSSMGMFLLARMALQQDREEEAAGLLAAARGRVVPTPWPGAKNRQVRAPRRIRSPRKVDLDALLKTEVPRVLLWTAINSCSQRGVSHDELVERFRLLVERFPAKEESQAAAAYLEDLERMLGADAPGEGNEEPLALGEELHELRAPVSELVHQLRDLRSSQNTGPESHFLEPESPSQKLQKLGVLAIPRLLTLTRDRTLTRVVPLFPRRRDPRDAVLRVGDVALQILSRHSIRQLKTPDEADAWWGAVQERGEAAVLEEMVLEASHDAPVLAHRLLEIDRGRAIRAAMGAVSQGRGRHRERLVSFVASQRSEVVRRFLLSEVRTGPSLRARLTAARTLQERGCSLWAEPLVAELQRLAVVGARRGSREARDILRLVVNSGCARSLESLRRVYPQLNAVEKRYALEAIAALPRDLSDRSALGEAILLRALEDEDIYRGTWLHAGIRCVDARLSEMAAVILALRQGEEPLDAAAPPYERDRRIAELGNRWRLARGLAPAPLPPTPTLPVAAPVEILRDAERAVLLADTPRAWEEASARYHQLGLSGLASLRSLLEDQSLDAARTEQLSHLASQVASTVSCVQLRDEEGILSQGEAARLESLLGHPLTAESLSHLISEQTSLGCVLHLSIHRDGAGRGVTLRLDVLSARKEENRLRVLYSTRIGAVYQRGSHFVRPERAKHDWARFESRVQQLFDAGPEVDGELRLQVGR